MMHSRLHQHSEVDSCGEVRGELPSLPEGQASAFKLKRGHLSSRGPLDGQDLLSNDGQNFQVDAVEFIKASPGTR